MADNTSSIEEHETELYRAIKEFIKRAWSSPWIMNGMAYAAKYGSYAQPLHEIGDGAQITFHPDRIDWKFTSNALSDDHIVLIHAISAGGGTWELLHDRHGTGRNHRILYNDDSPRISGITPQRLWAVSADIQHQLKKYQEIYLGGPPASALTPPEQRASPSHTTWAVAAIVGGSLALLCLCCFIGNFILAGDY